MSRYFYLLFVVTTVVVITQAFVILPVERQRGRIIVGNDGVFVAAAGTPNKDIPTSANQEDDPPSSLPFFLRDDVPEYPTESSSTIDTTFLDQVQNSLLDARLLANDLRNQAVAVTDTLSDQVAKIDWKELQTNVETFVQSKEVQQLKDSTVS
jgi:hypothetical protein